MIIPVNSLNINQQCKIKNKRNVNKTESPINITTQGNITKITFKGRLKNPTPPAIQMKVRGVSHHQKAPEGVKDNFIDRNVEKLANSNWIDEKRLSFSIQKFGENEKILLFDPKYGEIGRVPDEISPYLIKLLKRHGKDFRFQLSNVIAGTTKGAPTIGLRVNLLYTGKDPKIREKADRAFDFLLNSDDRGVADVIMPYQEKTSPKEILTRIFDIEEEANGTQTAKNILKTIECISNEINNPENKNILLLGHCLPDGDTLGCVLGMHAAIKSTYPNKNVKCSVDDKIPGLYRDKLPGINEVKRPYSLKSIQELEKNIAKLKAQPKSAIVRQQIKVYENELKELRKNETYFDPEVKEGENPTKFDLVILMDIPSPSRFSEAYKNYIQNAGKVIYIDHHPYHYDEWSNSEEKFGIDMEQIKEDNLSLIVPSIPAATQLVTVVSDKAKMLRTTLANQEYSKQFVAGIISGTSSDTGCFTRSANLTPEDIQKPVKQRPNFKPEGMAKWLIAQLDKNINKKWLREKIVYDIPDTHSTMNSNSAREKMIEYAKNSQVIYPKEGIGFVNITYEQMYEIWEEARKTDKKTTLIDIQNSFKYSEVMGALRDAPDKGPKNSAIESYASPYEEDKIAVLIIQDKEKGRLDSNSKLAEKNGIRMSFRSKEGTIYAELLASLFNGGGHGSAAGARIDLDGINIESKISVEINGKVERNPEMIYKALMKNYAIKNSSTLTDSEKIESSYKFNIISDEQGENIPEIIDNITKYIRKYTDT